MQGKMPHSQQAFNKILVADGSQSLLARGLAVTSVWKSGHRQQDFGSLVLMQAILPSIIPGDIQPPAQFGSKMILTNRGRLDRQAAEPGDQNTE